MDKKIKEACDYFMQSVSIASTSIRHGRVLAEAVFAADPTSKAGDERKEDTGEALTVAVNALKFYADGDHFSLSDPDAWDTVSGEPQNFQCDEAGTATVEDGSLAKRALQEMAGENKAYTEMITRNDADEGGCRKCNQPWTEHDFGVPEPFCPGARAAPSPIKAEPTDEEILAVARQHFDIDEKDTPEMIAIFLRSVRAIGTQLYATPSLPPQGGAQAKLTRNFDQLIEATERNGGFDAEFSAFEMRSLIGLYRGCKLRIETLEKELAAIAPQGQQAKAVGEFTQGTLGTECNFAGILGAIAAQALPVADTASAGSYSNLTVEQRFAVRQAENIGASDSYFKARTHFMDTYVNRNIFEAGFYRGWDAALQQTQGSEA